ncbi:hypothetical protein O3G_MSEX007102 [Manduca sexta]|uniref:Uncharacterized protein n=1 Tax=Manduca sexta TaxID=7130 RepID=A0A921Z738_MANSE|nr:hypothetical protein O3G_MSEX007102 [Manduca sexta]KAG6451397.1 hypothetical protein O3G_MSEX007102 [Manduca sexta]KAG6451398.1 hypothetical protein O3G_MSEX007102 [Manduca sexta]
MGKKNKDKTTGAVDIVSDTRTHKKRKHVNTDVSNVVINEPAPEKRYKTNKNNVVANDTKQDSDESKQTNKIDKHLNADNTDVNLVSDSKKAKRKKKDKTVAAANLSMPKNKKIIFDDDGHGVVNSLKPKDENAKKKKQFLSGEEAAVKEEEIDKFCDELDEEDNAQFDNWVKLIEERLHPTKKNKTS